MKRPTLDYIQRSVALIGIRLLDNELEGPPIERHSYKMI